MLVIRNLVARPLCCISCSKVLFWKNRRIRLMTRKRNICVWLFGTLSMFIVNRVMRVVITIWELLRRLKRCVADGPTVQG